MKRHPPAFALMASLALAVIGLCGCGRKVARDYSTAAYVWVQLRDRNQEFGLRQIESGSAGSTVPANIGGSPCRSLKPGTQKEGYLSFALDPAFKTNAETVTVTVEYFDATQGSFNVQYDGPDGPYTRCPGVTVQRRSLQWETAVFVLRRARFQNAQTNRADFRLRLRTPECFVRHVGVSRDVAAEALVSLGPASVRIELGDPPKEDYLRLVPVADGRTTPALLDGQPCHRLATTNSGYMYFAIAPEFKWDNRMNVKVEVEYFDASSGVLELQYDSWKPRAGDDGGPYGKCPYRVTLSRSSTWKKALFILPDARFENRQNGDADFRLRVTQPELYVRRVSVHRRDRLPMPAATSNVVNLTFGKPDVAQGLEQGFDPDSITAPANIDGQDCLAVQRYKGGYGYVYFVVDDAFKFSGGSNYVAEVEYYSAEPATFYLQYDGDRAGSRPAHAYTSTPRVQRPAGRWQKERFVLSNARFQNSQNGNADFRLRVFTSGFFVHQVSLRRQEVSSNN